MLKRCLDLLLAIVLSVLLAPVLLLVAVLIRIKLGSPVIFTQERPGLYGRKFNIFKFRTMTNEKNAQGDLLPDEERFTKFGKALRQLSIDELPQIFNVLRGELSLVGPRPLLTEYLPLYTPEQSRRHNVKPGITGWAQVHGRNAVSWEKKFELDVWYVDHQSVWLDFKILCMTVLKVVTREGIQHRGQTVNMSKFRGAAK